MSIVRKNISYLSLFAFICILGTHFVSYPMHLKLECTDGVIEMPYSLAQQCKILKNYIGDNEWLKIATNQESITSELGSIDLSKTNFTKQTIHEFMQLLQHKTTIEQYSWYDLKEIFAFADFIHAPKKLRNDLAHELLESNPRYYDIHLEEKDILMQNCYRSPQTLLHFKPSLISDLFHSDGSLHLSYLQLNTLDGIEEIANSDLKKAYDVKEIFLMGNKLTSLELERLKKAFPNAQYISAYNNEISELTQSDLNYVTDNMEIKLQSNKINSIEPSLRFNAPTNTTIHLKLNPLTKQALQNVLQSFKLSLWQRCREGIRPFHKFFSLSLIPLYYGFATSLRKNVETEIAYYIDSLGLNYEKSGSLYLLKDNCPKELLEKITNMYSALISQHNKKIYVSAIIAFCFVMGPFLYLDRHPIMKPLQSSRVIFDHGLAQLHQSEHLRLKQQTIEQATARQQELEDWKKLGLD